MDEKTVALAKIKAGSRGVQLATVSDMRETAAIMVASGMLPAGYDSPAKVFVGLQYGAEIGLRPMTAINSIAIIKGKPTLWGDAALGLVKSSDLLTDYSEEVTGVGEAMVAKVYSEREGKFKVTTTFSVEDAKTAGLWGKTGPWKTHPKRMLKYKARAFNLRDNFPDVLKGLHLQEEMVGEADIALEPPKCNVPPRDERRKVVSKETSPKAEAVPPLGSEAAGIRTTINMTSPPPQKPADTDSPVGSAGDILEAEVVEEIPLELTPFGKLWDSYETAGGTDFTAWAAEALCRDEDEVDSPEKFTVEMVDRLSRHLANAGV